jgi:hypothetical protein
MLHAPASNRQQSHNASSSGNFEHAGASSILIPGAMHLDKKSSIFVLFFMLLSKIHDIYFLLVQ